MSAADVTSPRRHTWLGVVAGVAGLALFAWTLRQTGSAPITEGLRRVGAGMIAILALSGVRFALRALAWTLCAEPRGALPYSHAFSAFVAGDALGNLTPLGLIASEPAKAAFARPRLTLMQALVSLALENLFYTLTVAGIIGGGIVALLFLFDVPQAIARVSLGALVVLALGVTTAVVVVWRDVRVVSPAAAWLHRRERGPAAIRARVDKLRDLEDTVYAFARRAPWLLAPLLLVEALFHLAAIGEVYVTLVLLLGDAAPGLLTTFVLEAVNRTINVVFKFVPLRLGVDEAGSEVFTRTLGLDAGLGVTMAVIRKVRVLVWSAVGVAFLVKRGVVGESAP